MMSASPRRAMPWDVADPLDPPRPPLVAPLRRMMTAGDRRPWEAVSTRASRQDRVLPFLAMVGISLVIVALPPGEPGRFTGLAVAALGFAAIGALIIVLPWERMPEW